MIFGLRLIIVAAGTVSSRNWYEPTTRVATRREKCEGLPLFERQNFDMVSCAYIEFYWVDRTSEMRERDPCNFRVSCVPTHRQHLHGIELYEELPTTTTSTTTAIPTTTSASKETTITEPTTTTVASTAEETVTSTSSAATMATEKTTTTMTEETATEQPATTTTSSASPAVESATTMFLETTTKTLNETITGLPSIEPVAKTPKKQPHHHHKGHHGAKGKGKGKKAKTTKEESTTLSKKDDDDASTIEKIIDLYEPTATQTEAKPSQAIASTAPTQAPATGKVPDLSMPANELAKQNVVDWYLVHL
ncbi:hypothetical protein TELCIR_09857 [Teladorsagia circumcincta]|uniref:Uncharacterized protein n=1 Tax=Teladorsagia circumcincta TaxID=45464 RepID=A0A2G9UDN9_TELCI|nr:hypothetical protein TELCIR_09857 [Teladorsagia circumcincta]